MAGVDALHSIAYTFLLGARAHLVDTSSTGACRLRSLHALSQVCAIVGLPIIVVIDLVLRLSLLPVVILLLETLHRAVLDLVHDVLDVLDAVERGAGAHLTNVAAVAVRGLVDVDVRVVVVDDDDSPTQLRVVLQSQDGGVVTLRLVLADQLLQMSLVRRQLLRVELGLLQRYLLDEHLLLLVHEFASVMQRRGHIRVLAVGLGNC